MKEYFYLVLKGMGMGAANVIPGVSGGTVALITGIFEKLIDSIKSLNIKAVKFLLKGKFKDFADYINLKFLIAVFLGIAISIISFAKLLEFLFQNYSIYVWSYFFGLILASVYFVSLQIEKRNLTNLFIFIFGASIAVYISFMTPASQNDNVFYLVLCGIIAASSMILPGLSGSFVLILLGNYQLVMIDSVSHLNLKVLLPVAVGAGVGLIGFSSFLSWIFKKYKDQTISILAGFIFGSLTILWPWKEPVTKVFGEGIHAKEKIVSYIWQVPDFNISLIISIILMVLGYISIWLMEKYAKS